jgi:hypothetical protein
MPKAKSSESKAEPTEEMILYMEYDSMYKRAEAGKTEIKPIVISQLNVGEFEGIKLGSSKRRNIDKEKFYLWVSATWPDKVDSLKIDEIDPLKFEAAYALGEIDYESIPEDVYTTTIVESVYIQSNRKKGKV